MQTKLTYDFTYPIQYDNRTVAEIEVAVEYLYEPGVHERFDYLTGEYTPPMDPSFEVMAFSVGGWTSKFEWEWFEPTGELLEKLMDYVAEDQFQEALIEHSEDLILMYGEDNYEY